MGMPVVTVASGGMPVVEATLGTPVTEAANKYGVPVTKVIGKPGLPVRFETIGVGGGGPPVTGLIGWWDASVTASLTLSGADILSVADQSTSGVTMNNVNAIKPQYSATGFNGTKPAMVFTAASSTALQGAAFPMGTGTTMTVWAVCTMGGAGTNNYGRILAYNKPGALDSNNAGSWAFHRNNLNADQLTFARTTNLVSGVNVTIHPAPHRIIFTVKSDGSVVGYADNTVILTGSRPGDWVSAGTVNMGRTSVNDSFWSGPVAECGIATGYSDAAAVLALDTYLKNKWGL